MLIILVLDDPILPIFSFSESLKRTLSYGIKKLKVSFKFIFDKKAWTISGENCQIWATSKFLS